MSHFFFCIKEYTNKQGSNWLSFLATFFVVLYTIYNDVWRHLSASL